MPPTPRRGTSYKSYWLLLVFIRQVRLVGRIRPVRPLTPDPWHLSPDPRNLTSGAKITKNIFISYFFNLFYISSLVVRHSSFVTRHSSFVTRHSSFVTRHLSFVTRHFLTFFLYFSLLFSFYFVVYQTATFLVIYIFTIQCFSIFLTFYLCARIRS